MKYTLVVHHAYPRTEIANEYPKFISKVNKMLEEGWVPQGGLSFGNYGGGTYLQAMVKYDEQ